MSTPSPATTTEALGMLCAAMGYLAAASATAMAAETTTAWNKDKTKVLHSHSPPERRAG